MKVYCYILQLSNQTHYCGITKDITKRIIQHNCGMSQSTRLYRPVSIVFLKTFEDYKQARILEKNIKMGGVTKWLHKNITLGIHKAENEYRIFANNR